MLGVGIANMVNVIVISANSVQIVGPVTIVQTSFTDYIDVTGESVPHELLSSLLSDYHHDNYNDCRKRCEFYASDLHRSSSWSRTHFDGYSRRRRFTQKYSIDLINSRTSIPHRSLIVHLYRLCLSNEERCPHLRSWYYHLWLYLRLGILHYHGLQQRWNDSTPHHN